ncbi:MAG TPA: tetratricopeptide repeat protein [Blastocatellia bacterium]|jgi:tetratricopeptide (TPR) repeat protein
MFYKKSILTFFMRLAIFSSLLMATLVATSVAQDPSGRPTDTPSKGKRPPTKRNPSTRADPTPITVTLTILTDPPESSVYINGESRGVTSAEGKIQLEKLALGRYSVEVRKDGYNSMIRGFQAGSESPTLVFKLEPNLEEYVKEFDALTASGKLTGPESPNAFEIVNTLSTKFPSRPEVARLRSALSAKFAETITPVINNTVVNWRSVSRDDIARALDRAKGALALKEDNRRAQAEAAYLAGALALRDWQASGDAMSEANPTQSTTKGLRTDTEKENGGATAASGTLASAKAEFEKALGFEDSFTAARFQLGVVLQASGDFAGAEAALVRVTQLEPRWTPAYIALGSAYHAQGKYKEAIEAYRKAIELAPNQAAAVAGLGLARVAKGEKDGVRDIERAMQLDPTSGLPNFNLAIVYSQSKSKKDLARAEEEFKKAIAKNTGNMEFSNRKAERLLAELQKRKK